ncbi:probable G-protein coupled receptor B0563.6 [Gigantopelta aegis]|uniref:probable G-protein coupled receptor B0563.6 n=1 Tax=Gigantopelta aegis TaxID=1735272 RepID=UPI001B88C9A3|nr:probable G-protein coupled receptor B0563.6 [Gigantopelta aegis]
MNLSHEIVYFGKSSGNFTEMKNLNMTMSSDYNDTIFMLNNVTLMDIVSNMTNITAGDDSSMQTAKLVEKICSQMLPIVCIFGILCNILNLLILTERYLKESPYSYLTAMATTDLCALILTFIFAMFSMKNPNSYYWKFYDAHLYYPLVNICCNSSVWFIVLLTIDRFLFVHNPLWAKAKCDRMGALIKICVVLVLISIINIPRFLTFKVWYRVDDSGFTYQLASTEFRHTYAAFIITWSHSIIINFIPLTILMTSNIYIVYAVQRARVQRQIMKIGNNKEATWHREQMRLTVTLISIVCLFVICIMPSAFADRPVAWALYGKFIYSTSTELMKSAPYKILQAISNLLLICNLSLNYVLYCAFNDKFLRVFKTMVLRWVKVIRRTKIREELYNKLMNRRSLNGQVSMALSAMSMTNGCNSQMTKMSTSKSDSFLREDLTL